MDHRRSSAFAAPLLVLLLALTVPAHTTLDSPNGGEVFAGGASILIQWHVAIQHNTIGWDLEYSVNGSAGPWLPIALGLPAGNTSGGAPHSFLWTAPAINSSTVRIRVKMDNTGTDYYDMSNGDFSINSALTANLASLSISAGGTQQLTLDAGTSHGGDLFAVVGSITGTSPGIPFGGFVLPLNQDFYFDQTVLFPNSHPLTNSFSNLDLNGTAVTTVTVNAGELPPIAIGITVHHAAVVLDATLQLTLVSNPVALTLTP